MPRQYIHYFDSKNIISETQLALSNQQNEHFFTCPKHKDDFKHYCLTCNQLLCNECISQEPHQSIQPKSKQHDFEPINLTGYAHVLKLHNQLSKYKSQIYSVLDLLKNDNNNNLFNHQNHNQQSSSSSNESVEQLVSYLNKNYHKAINDIDNMHKYYKQLLDERKQDLHNELNSIYNSKQLLINNIQSISKNEDNVANITNKIDNVVNYTQKLLKNCVGNSASLHELLLIKQPVEQKLEELIERLKVVTNGDKRTRIECQKVT